jgi:hypothetical protein
LQIEKPGLRPAFYFYLQSLMQNMAPFAKSKRQSEMLCLFLFTRADEGTPFGFTAFRSGQASRAMLFNKKGVPSGTPFLCG